MIVADTSWVVALRDPHDGHHPAAVALSAALGDEPIAMHPLTLAECLVGPAKLGVLDKSAAALRAAFDIAAFDADAPLRWTALRAAHALRLPDVVVLDTALHLCARGIATFDAGLAAACIAAGLDALPSDVT